MKNPAPATAMYDDTYAGKVEVALVRMGRTDRYYWKRDNGQVVGAMARALPVGRAVAYARWHKSFSNVQEA